MTIKPLGARVLVKQEKLEEKTKSGIVIPSRSKEKPNWGTVVEVGPGEKKEDYEVKVTVKKGDRVIYRKYSGTEVKVGDEKYLILDNDDLLAVLE